MFGVSADLPVDYVSRLNMRSHADWDPVPPRVRKVTEEGVLAKLRVFSEVLSSV